METSHGTYGDPGYFREVDGTPQFFYGTPGSGTPHWATEQPRNFRIRTKSGDHMIEANPSAGGGHDVTHTKPGGAVETAHHATKAAAIRDVGERAYEAETAAKASGEHVETGAIAETMREKAPPSPGDGEQHRNSMGTASEGGINYHAGSDAGAFAGMKLFNGRVKEIPNVGEVVEFGVQRVGKKQVVPTLKTSGRPELKELADKHREASALKAARSQWRPSGYQDVVSARAAHENAVSKADRAVSRGERLEDPAVERSDHEDMKGKESQHPEAAAFHDAERLRDSASWSDPTGKASSAEAAMETIRNGGSAEEARSAMSKRSTGYVD